MTSNPRNSTIHRGTEKMDSIHNLQPQPPILIPLLKISTTPINNSDLFNPPHPTQFQDQYHSPCKLQPSLFPPSNNPNFPSFSLTAGTVCEREREREAGREREYNRKLRLLGLKKEPTSPARTAMAACGSLQHIFDNTLPDSQSSILESFSSWKKHHHHHLHHHHHQIMSTSNSNDDDGGKHNPIDHQSSSSFTEIFGELHFKDQQDPKPTTMELEKSNNSEENAKSPSSVSSPGSSSRHGHHRSSESFSSMNSESLQLCTEGLGFESFGDVEDSKLAEAWQATEEKESAAGTNKAARRNFYLSSSFKHHPHNHPPHHLREFRRSRSIGSGFPPPISSLSTSGKPWVCFKSYRNDGRFVLKEIRFPTQEFLHASREGGRLTLQFVHPGDDIEEDEGILEDDNDGEDDEGGEREEEEGRGQNGGYRDVEREEEEEEKRKEACRGHVGLGGGDS